MTALQHDSKRTLGKLTFRNEKLSFVTVALMQHSLILPVIATAFIHFILFYSITDFIYFFNLKCSFKYFETKMFWKQSNTREVRISSDLLCNFKIITIFVLLYCKNKKKILLLTLVCFEYFCKQIL